MGALEPSAWGRVCRDTRPRARRAGERLADLPDSLLPVSGVAAATTSRAAPTASAINCRTRWPSSIRSPGSRASICCAVQSASSAKVTSSTGGILPPGKECALTRPTIISGCRTRPAGTCRRRATQGCSTNKSPFVEGRELSPDEEAYYDQPQRSTDSRDPLRTLRPLDQARAAFRPARVAADGNAATGTMG